MQALRKNKLLTIIAIALAALIVVSLTLTVLYDAKLTSPNDVKLTGFAPYANSGAQTAYQMGILESGVNVGEIAVAAGTINDSATPVVISLYFMSNTSFGFEIDCVAFSISQSNAKPVLGSVQAETPPAEINLRAVENSTASARVVSYCNAQYVNKEGWAEFNSYFTPNGNSSFIVSVTLEMTRGANQFNESNSVTLDGLTFSA